MNTIAERVAAGAAFLDEHDVGWWEDVDLNALDLGHCDKCVLGQLVGDYEAGLMEFNLSDYKSTLLGFREEGLFQELCDYASLTAEWKRVITERRAAS